VVLYEKFIANGLSGHLPDVEGTIAMFANIIDAAEHKVKCLQHGDSV
jgi:hypothetical protein